MTRPNFSSPLPIPHVIISHSFHPDNDSFKSDLPCLLPKPHSMSSNRRSATEAARARFASQLTPNTSGLSVHPQLCCPIHHNRCTICRDYIAHLLEDPGQADAFAEVIPDLLNSWERRLDDVIQACIDDSYTQGRQDEARLHPLAEPAASLISRTPSGSTDDGSFVTAPESLPQPT